MPQLNLNISNDLDTRFRAKIFKTKGLKRGNMQEALTEALELWIKK